MKWREKGILEHFFALLFSSEIKQHNSLHPFWLGTFPPVTSQMGKIL